MIGDADVTGFCGVGLIITDGPSSEGNPFGSVMSTQDYIEAYGRLHKSSFMGNAAERDSLHHLIMRGNSDDEIKKNIDLKNYICCQLMIQGSKVHSFLPIDDLPLSFEH
jgi:hypothetical protein